MSEVSGTRRSGRLVRPYAMTGGRTGAEFSRIAFEAHVVATEFGLRKRNEFRWEAAELIGHSEKATAIIELAARLEVPIGVVRVIAGDLSAEGAVVISNPASEVAAHGGEEYVDLLTKVLDGIKSI